MILIFSEKSHSAKAASHAQSPLPANVTFATFPVERCASSRRALASSPDDVAAKRRGSLLVALLTRSRLKPSTKIGNRDDVTAVVHMLIKEPHCGNEGLSFSGIDDLSQSVFSTVALKFWSYDTIRHEETATKAAPCSVSNIILIKCLKPIPNHKALAADEKALSFETDNSSLH